METVSTENKEELADLVVAIGEWIRRVKNERVELTLILRESDDRKGKK